jgi:hypothetical protein
MGQLIAEGPKPELARVWAQLVVNRDTGRQQLGWHAAFTLSGKIAPWRRWVGTRCVRVEAVGSTKNAMAALTNI